MNISSQISSFYESNSSGYLFSNGTEVETEFEVSSVIYIICVLLSFPISSYVIWLIVTGTGNGLAAEIFILNLSACEILFCLETILLLFKNKLDIFSIGVGFLDGLLFMSHSLFECLVSVERYLAVVHPVTFLKYKPLRYRLMCCAVAWIAIFASGGISVVIWFFCFRMYYIYWLALFLAFLSIQLFCLVAVLRALKQSGPGERGREMEEENHMKRKAFYLILITTLTMLIIYVTYFILIYLPTAEIWTKMSIGQFCFTLAGLVQPVLFLYRVGKPNFKCK